jgi:hypothetical protein
MKSLRILAVASLLLSIPAVAFAGVTFKNKEKKQVDIVIKRAGSSQTTSVAAGLSMDIPGSPMTLTISQKAPAKGKPPAAITMDAVEGDTVTWANGKLTKVAAEETPDPGKSEPEATEDKK